MEKGLGAVVPCLFGCALALALAGCQLPREAPAPTPESQAPLAMAEETVCALRARYAQGAIDKADLLRAELVAAQVRLLGTPRADQAAYASACGATLGKLEAALQTPHGRANPSVGEARLWFQEAVDGTPLH